MLFRSVSDTIPVKLGLHTPLGLVLQILILMLFNPLGSRVLPYQGEEIGKGSAKEPNTKVFAPNLCQDKPDPQPESPSTTYPRSQWEN